jgi:hypothetical protein
LQAPPAFKRLCDIIIVFALSHNSIPLCLVLSFPPPHELKEMASQLPLNSAAPEFVEGVPAHKTINLDTIVLPENTEIKVLEGNDAKSLGQLKDQAVSTLQKTVQSADTLSACCRDIAIVTVTNLETHEVLRKQVNNKRRALHYLDEGNKLIQTHKVCPSQQTCNGDCGFPHKPTADGSVPEIPAMHNYAKATSMDVVLFNILRENHSKDTKTIANSTVSDLKKAGGNRESLVAFNESVSVISGKVNDNIASISKCLTFTKTLSQKILELAQENGKLDSDIQQAKKIRYKLKQSVVPSS